tara:strand:+ start:2078 stop:2347 length:270 start_codon:yes stop_codon:yes gene_type:complete
MKRILGILIFIITSLILLFTGFEIFDNQSGHIYVDIWVLYIPILYCILIIIYLKTTDFWKKTEVQIIDEQNELLKKQIEQKELKKKLEE